MPIQICCSGGQANTTWISYADLRLAPFLNKEHDLINGKTMQNVHPSEEFLIYFSTYYKIFGVIIYEKKVTDLE